jgi:hypothetical protein
MEKHKNILSRQTNHQSRQRLLFDNTATPSPSNKTSEFSKDLCEMMLSANIPLNKVNNEQFKTFLKKYTTHLIPDESTLRKYYVPACYEGVLKRIRCTVGDNKVWVSIDEKRMSAADM